jgi:hypothetical protein
MTSDDAAEIIEPILIDSHATDRMATRGPRIRVTTRAERRRIWSVEQKREIVAESIQREPEHQYRRRWHLPEAARHEDAGNTRTADFRRRCRTLLGDLHRQPATLSGRGHSASGGTGETLCRPARSGRPAPDPVDSGGVEDVGLRGHTSPRNAAEITRPHCGQLCIQRLRSAAARALAH